MKKINPNQVATTIRLAIIIIAIKAMIIILFQWRRSSRPLRNVCPNSLTKYSKGIKRRMLVSHWVKIK